LVGRAQARWAEDVALAFRAVLQSALALVTTVPLVGRRPFPLDQEHALELRQVRAPLGRDRRFDLRLALGYRLEQTGRRDWSVRTTGYSYWLYEQGGQELMLYQWHQGGPSPVTTPHLHLSALGHAALPDALRDRFAPLSHAHFPTGFVTVAELIDIAIADLGVEPLEGDRAMRRARLLAAQQAQAESFGLDLPTHFSPH
jgi:hypothetical protein